MTGSLLLTRNLQAPFPEPQWPPGVVLSSFHEEDAPACHVLLLRGYAEGGGEISASFDEWWRATASDPEFDPELLFLAKTSDGVLAGLALCWTSGFVKDIVVEPAHRRQGVGEALLLEAFGVLQRRGHSRIGLKLPSDSPYGARRLYDRLGFVLG
ncbi:MAG TPA: GNAT family N-acetyltransferase [Devosiaceae bacterium]|jgi:ribosomal protein S18 acetylase RimI-like enzyme|nr:GNAT family N-acetyltransferase [Devosiaceae bacterium]